MLPKTTELMSVGLVLHAGGFGEVANVFVQAVTAQPDQDPDVGSVLW